MSQNDPNLSEQQENRIEKLQALRAAGVNPFPYSFDVSHKTDAIKADASLLEGEPENRKRISVAGRMMTRRIMGKASFFNLQDSVGTIQVYVKGEIIGEQYYNDVFKHLIDLGDIVGVKGYAFFTKTGELSIHADQFELLSKTVRPLPVAKEVEENGVKVVYDAFSDKEQRYRLRYVDLVVNPQIRDVFRKRTQLVNTMRRFMDENGLLEVETPILQPLYGGAAARPFTTHHNALDMQLYLRISNELYLKRLIVGGFDGVYEFSKDFRNEGMSRFHNPEFTQVELYVAYKDYNWMMDFVEAMVEKVALALHGTTEVTFGDKKISFARPWKRIPMYESIKEMTGYDLTDLSEEETREVAKKLRVDVDDSMGKGKLIDEIFGEYVEPKLIQPTFITDYPLEMSPLAKKHRTKEGLVERFEAICNGKEICNSFSELNDPQDQRERFEEQAKLRTAGDEEAMELDEDFIRSLEYGMPPTAGLGIGIDRLTMIMTNQESIRDVLFFPHMRPE